MTVLRVPEAAMIVGKGLQQMMIECASLDLEGKKIIPFLNPEDKDVKSLVRDVEYLDYRLKEIYRIYLAVINETIEMDEKEKFPQKEKSLKKDETLKLAE